MKITKKKLFFIVILFILIAGASGYVGKEVFSTHTKDIDTVKVELTEVEIMQIQAKARINYITLDSAWAIAEELCEQRINIHWIDSTKWHDSTKYVYKDTTIYIYQPVVDSLYADYNWYQEHTDTVMIEDKWSGFGLSLFTGVGATYGATDFLHKSSTSNEVYWKPNDWSWYWGAQFGIGITYTFIKF